MDLFLLLFHPQEMGLALGHHIALDVRRGGQIRSRILIAPWAW